MDVGLRPPGGLSLTLVHGAFRPRGEVVPGPWEEWAASLTMHDVRVPLDGDPESSKDGVGVVLGPCRGGVRGRDNVLEIHAVALDVEKRPHTIAMPGLLGGLRGLEAVVYTTHRHGADPRGPRLRAIVPLAAPLDPAAYWSLWDVLDAACGNVGDQKARDPWRLHYLPSTWHEGGTGGGVAEAVRLRGMLLDPLAALAARGAYLDGLGRVAVPGAAGPGAPPADPHGPGAQRRVAMILGGVKRTDPLHAAAQAVLRGEALAAEGGRADAVRDLTWLLAERDAGLPPEAVADVFGPALAASGADAPTPQHAAEAYARAAQKHRQGYGPEELAAIATREGLEPDDLARAWIVQKDSTYWALGPRGFEGPYSKDEARPAVARALRRAPVMLEAVAPTTGAVRRRNVGELVEDHGTVALRVVADLAAQATRWYPASRTLVEAVRPLRNLEPRWDGGIEAWLADLGGDQSGKLLDWLCVFPDLRQLLAALYLHGSEGLGKTLVAAGLARLWHDGPPVPITSAMGSFPEELTVCPVILADEDMPRRTSRGAPATSFLRTLLSISERFVERKHRTSATLRGALRLVMAANNEDMLAHDGMALTSKDIEALTKRFLFLEPARTAQQVPPERYTEWVLRDGLARHVLALAAGRRPTQDGRFWVRGDPEAVRRILVRSSDWNSRVCEWLVRYLLRPEPFESRRSGLTRRGSAGDPNAPPGTLLVNDDAVVGALSLYVQTKESPDTRQISAALRAVSTDERRQLRHDGRRVRYRMVDVRALEAWASQHGLDPDAVRTAVGLAPREDDRT